MKENNIIKSVDYKDDIIINNIIKLHCCSQIELDPCYSKGNFYKSGVLKKPIYRFDISPQSEDVIKADCRNLPLNNNTINTIIYDPPFLATKGASLLKNDKSNKINKRFGVYPNEKELHFFYWESLNEFYRILKQDGILIVKCQDKVSSGIQYLSHVFIINEAEKIGYYTKDIFILVAKNRIVADWQLKNQKHARKFHAYYIVFQKSTKRVKY